ncbi:MAG: DoxX family membrane protein [Ignavibacteria bacterium]|nr:DoxX family membrane protein [Ignavibacteria bacterium]
MNFLSNKYFLLILRLIVGGTFIYACAGKLLNQELFARAIYNYKFLPDVFINIFAIVMPYLELVTAVFLILGIFKRGSAFMIIVMLIVFIISLTQAYARGLDISCGCFSLETVSEKSDILLRIIEDIFLLVASFIIFIKSKPIIKQEIQQ